MSHQGGGLQLPPPPPLLMMTALHTHRCDELVAAAAGG